MKKIIPFLVCMLIALWACEKDTPTPPASIDSMQFESVPSFIDEGADINLSQYLIITPEAVGDTVTVEWSSSDKEIATVSASGSVEALRAGDVTITAKAMDKTAQVKLTIDKVKIKEFTIPATLEVYVGEKIKFPINDLKPKKAPLYRFEWEADNDGKIPTYSEGKWYLKADKEREFTLTVSVDDAEEAKCEVKFVKPSVSKLTFNPTSYTVEEAGSLSLKTNLQITAAEGFKSDTVKVVWSSNKESVATVDQTGKVKAVSAGKTTITASAGSKIATCTVEVTSKSTPEDPEKPSDPEKPEYPDTPVDPSDPVIPMDKEFTITFEANGGTGYMQNLIVKEGNDVTLPANNFVKKNAEFKGWNTKADGKGSPYTDKATIKVTEDITLYAQWVEVFTISFDANGGVGKMSPISGKAHSGGVLPANQFTKNGYIFVKWNTNADGSGVDLKDKSSVTFNENYTLYAQWKKDYTHNGHEYVDLGLPSGTLWATMYIGATSPEGYGEFFAWGETTSKSSFTSSNYKYTGTSSTLPLNNDAANVIWGGNWRMPTQEEVQELIDNCTWNSFTITYTEKRVYQAKSKINGNSIYLLCGGLNDGTGVINTTHVYIWTNSNSVTGKAIGFTTYNGRQLCDQNKYYGLCIRPVFNK